MSTYNPAPWEVIDGREGANMETDTIGHFRVEAVKMCFSPLIARVGFDNLFAPEHDEETGFANACLIAAAPLMYRALKELSDFWGHGLSVPDNKEHSAKARQIATERAEELGRMAGVALAAAEGRNA